jgi:hypothetical protein
MLILHALSLTRRECLDLAAPTIHVLAVDATVRAAGPRIYVKASMPGLAATSEGVTPVSVRLSPWVSWIVRPDELLVA